MLKMKDIVEARPSKRVCKVQRSVLNVLTNAFRKNKMRRGGSWTWDGDDRVPNVWDRVRFWERNVDIVMGLERF
jgi:hypothetical protein